MTKKELLEVLSGIPDHAEVYVEADHGQIPMRASNYDLCVYNHEESPWMGDDLNWVGICGGVYDESIDEYDDQKVEDIDKSKVKCVLITAY